MTKVEKIWAEILADRNLSAKEFNAKYHPDKTSQDLSNEIFNTKLSAEDEAEIAMEVKANNENVN